MIAAESTGIVGAAAGQRKKVAFPFTWRSDDAGSSEAHAPIEFGRRPERVLAILRDSFYHRQWSDLKENGMWPMLAFASSLLQNRRGMGDLPVRCATGPDCAMMYNIPEIRGRGEFGGYEVREQYLH